MPQSPCAVIPVLPDELVVWEILVRLPAKALLRCRAVCGSWRRLTSDADFLLAHHRRQTSLPLVFFRGQISVHVVGDALDAFDLRGDPATAERRPILRLPLHDFLFRQYKVYASCDGLLLFSLCNRSFYICNPATRQRNALPSLIGTNVAGLYQHSPSGEYRILHRRRRYPELNSAYYILTVGPYAKPRCIGLPAATVSASIKQYIAAGLLFVCGHPPVLLHSCLHWIVYSSQENALVVFDTVSESFRCMSPPTENGQWQHLLDMDGALGISHMDESKVMMKLWVLQDYKTEVWSLKHQIELPMVELSVAMKCSFEVLVVSEKGDVLIYCSSFCHIFHCDSTGKLLHKFQWDRMLSMPTGYWFKESLVRHAFFQGQ
ncbi:hypothetical protein SEVIR_1G120000v4 [Setaria viridis]|uniref:F-box domain-containing protein n=1 Tax=Setaria viridis TaxID=4556 RepID=A0A4U6W972_SETVI|nr:F-box protein At5g49610-like [Setaria viridis]TKW38513.1 hypothetical protein SEVIR_1G120000v2 [Setaria viridis]TKW38514.1 hypothetical protein SEVIR_1G120000v2 [Setaria viridis]TKW38515.1 hypothetical protein SEVIR_1G120000v2 [Setaria viridis]